MDAGRHFGDQIVAILDGRPRDVASGARATAERHAAGEWSAILQRDRDVVFERVLRADPQAALRWAKGGNGFWLVRRVAEGQ